MAHGMDEELDRLFQLPLGEFTAARNVLAKQAGSGGAAIKGLSKPPVAAWAVNQLFFRDRERYDALVEASLELRRTHEAVLGGRGVDLRSATREHDIALDAAVKATLALMKEAGQPVTDATRQAIVTTLRALPGDESPGRLTRTLAPGGFEMLAGISLRGGAKPAVAPARKPSVPSGRVVTGPSAGKDARAEREAARERERRVAAERAVRDAEHRARQAEFEAARASRESDKAADRLRRAQQAFDEAKAERDEAQREATAKAQASESASRRFRQAENELKRLGGPRQP